MKIFLISFIVIMSGHIGYLYKTKFIKQQKAIEEFKNYCLYFKDNLLLFKNNIHEIHINYINTHKNKNANNVIITLKNVSMYQINLEYLRKMIYKNELYFAIEKYICVQGQNEYEYEINKINDLINILNRESELTKEDLKQKGDLYFKLMIAMGVVVAILLW